MKGGIYQSFAHKQLKHFLDKARFGYAPTELKPSAKKEKERWGESESVKKSKLMRKALNCDVEEWEIERVQNSLGSNVFASAQKAAQLLKRVKAIRKKDGNAAAIDATTDESEENSSTKSDSDSDGEGEDDDHDSILASMDTIHVQRSDNMNSPAANLLEQQDTDDEEGEGNEGGDNMRVRKILFKIDVSDDDDDELMTPNTNNYSFVNVNNSFMSVDTMEAEKNMTNANLASLPNSPLNFYRTARHIDRDDIFDALGSLPPSVAQSPYRPSMSTSMSRTNGKSIIDDKMDLSAIAGPQDMLLQSISQSLVTKRSGGYTQLRNATMAIEPAIRDEVDAIILNLQKDYVSNIQNDKFIRRLFGFADNAPNIDKRIMMRNRFVSETEFFDSIRRCLSNGNLRFGRSSIQKTLNESISNEAIWSFYQLLSEHKKLKGEKEARPVVDLWKLLRMLKTGNFLRDYDAKHATNGPLHFETKEDYQRYAVSTGVYTAGKTANPQPLGNANRHYAITRNEMEKSTNIIAPCIRRDLYKHLHTNGNEVDGNMNTNDQSFDTDYLASPGVKSALGGDTNKEKKNYDSNHRYEQSRRHHREETVANTKHNSSKSLRTVLTKQFFSNSEDDTHNINKKDSRTSDSRQAKLLLGPDGALNSDYESLGITADKELGPHIFHKSLPSKAMCDVLTNAGINDKGYAFKGGKKVDISHHHKNEETKNNSNNAVHVLPNYHHIKSGHGKLRTLHREQNTCTVGQALHSGYTHVDTAGRSSEHDHNIDKKFSSSRGYLRRESERVDSSGVHQAAFKQAGGRKHFSKGAQSQESIDMKI